MDCRGGGLNCCCPPFSSGASLGDESDDNAFVTGDGWVRLVGVCCATGDAFLISGILESLLDSLVAEGAGEGEGCWLPTPCGYIHVCDFLMAFPLRYPYPNDRRSTN